MATKFTPEERASGRLLDFTALVRPDLNPNWHHRLLADRLQRVESGEIKRLIVQMPPGHGKSTLSTQLFPAWYLGRHPERDLVVVSHGKALASDFGREVRNVIAGPAFRSVFPRVGLTPDSKSTSLFHVTPSDGSLYAVGMGGSLTGKRANGLLIDDPVKDDAEADSVAVKSTQRAWYRSVAHTRLQPGAFIVIILTRWREDDLAGWLLKEFGEEEWHVVSMPCIAEKGEEWQIGREVVRRQKGEPLWPGYFSEKELALKKKVLGTRGWHALYQQNPLPGEGAGVQLSWFRRWWTPPLKINRIVLSVDSAQKEKELSDPTCITVWAETDGGDFLLDLWCKPCAFPELIRVVTNMGERRWPDKERGQVPSAILIEDKSSGTSLIQMLRANTRLPVIAIEPEGSKQVRWQRCSPTIEAGNVYLPQEAPWLIDYEAEISAFPLGAHDDQVDSTSQYLNWRLQHSLTGYDEGAAEQTMAAFEEVMAGKAPASPAAGWSMPAEDRDDDDDQGGSTMMSPSGFRF